MHVANVKHSHCEAKFGFRVWETEFGRVRRKTAPTFGTSLNVQWMAVGASGVRVDPIRHDWERDDTHDQANR